MPNNGYTRHCALFQAYNLVADKNYWKFKCLALHSIQLFFHWTSKVGSV